MAAKQIINVDDEAQILALLGILFNRAGFTV
jgi:DNA-binding response OmpR family regulator